MPSVLPNGQPQLPQPTVPHRNALRFLGGVHSVPRGLACCCCCVRHCTTQWMVLIISVPHWYALRSSGGPRCLARPRRCCCCVRGFHYPMDNHNYHNLQLPQLTTRPSGQPLTDNHNYHSLPSPPCPSECLAVSRRVPRCPARPPIAAFASEDPTYYPMTAERRHRKHL